MTLQRANKIDGTRRPGKCLREIFAVIIGHNEPHRIRSSSRGGTGTGMPLRHRNAKTREV